MNGRMIRKRARSSHESDVPSEIRSDDDYRRVMQRIIDITDGQGAEPQPGELSDLLSLAEAWEERAIGNSDR
jgi:hypothetical protein